MCMKENLIHSRTCVYNINYHVVWSVKYRRKILNTEVESFLKELVQEIAQDKGFIVHLFEIGEGDHVHCVVSAPPKLSVTDIVKYLKGITGRKLFEHFPQICQNFWKGQLWNHSYYVETIGSVSEENIRRYIEHQSKSY
ncbi:IS200/IS605 family transposase [Hespellia stercorisuis]|nr:IS200/IS605 family transposase [Hespellia stercorisuis]